MINPNLALGWHNSGWIKVWLGEPDRAIERFAQAMRLNPIDPSTFGMQEGMAHAHFFAGRYDEALSWAKVVLRELPVNHAALRIGATSGALAGRDEEAKGLMARLLEIDPTLCVSSFPTRRSFPPAPYRGYSRFCELYRSWEAKLSVTMRPQSLPL